MAEQIAQIDSKSDALQFSADHAEVFEAQENQSALDFARQFDNPENIKPVVDADAAPDAPGFTGSVARDVSLGVVHAPRSIVRGVRNGIQNFLDIGHEVDKFFNTPALQVFNEKGQFDPAIVGVRDAEKRGVKRLATLPEIDKPKTETVTGNLIEAVSQFAAGFKGVDKVIKASAALSGGAAALQSLKGGQTALSVIKGAAADLAVFDDQDQRLSNVIQSVPALQNPVTEYLQASPDDSFAEGKFKQAVEGLTLGGLSDVVFDGVRLLKKGKEAKAALSDEKIVSDLFDVPLEEKAGIGVTKENFDFLGNPDDASYLRPKTKMQIAEEEAQGAFGKTKQISDAPAASIDDFEINFSRINAPDDIKQLMDEMVNKPELKASIDAARRGKMDNRATLTAATDIDGFDSLMQRRTGDAFNAETVVAARKVYYDTTTKLMEAARRAAAPEASDIDQFQFRKMVATHHAVQKEFMGVRAEAGRALQAWSIPVAGGGGENLRALQQVLNEFGGADASKELAKRLAAAGNNLNTAQINSMTQKAASARTADAVSEAWTLGLLTNPTTHIVNLTSNVLTGLMLGAERIGMALTKDSPVTLKEGAAYFAGLMDAQKAGMKNAAQAFRTGATGIGVSKIDLPRARSTARDILDPNGAAGIFSQALDYYGSVLTKYAGGALAAGDEYSKTVLYQAQLRALAVRDGIAQGMDGAALKEHIAKTLAEPPASLRADAVQFANYGTFTKELGALGQSVQRATAKQPLLRFVVPFVRTPANIFKFTFERTPLAPLSQRVRDDIAAGGVRRSAALTKIGMGTSVMAIGADMASNGTITGAGPADPGVKAALRRTGWQPYSIKLGDTYYSYSRFEPLATVLGMSADLAEILGNYEAYDIDAQQQVDSLVTAMAIAAGNQVVGKTFLRGFADLAEALSDPGRYGEGFINRFAGSFVPAGVAAVEKAIDPATSEVFNLRDQIKSRIPGLSADVPSRRNIWGEEIKAFYPNEKALAGATAERLMSLFNPVYYSAAKDAPIDRWMLANGFEIDMPQKAQSFDGVRIDLRDYPKAYERLVILRGQDITLTKYAGQTMKQFFDDLANEEDPYGRHIGFFMGIGNSFDDQQNFINQVVRDYNEAAKEQVLEEFPDLVDAIAAERRKALSFEAVRPSMRELQKGVTP